MRRRRIFGGSRSSRSESTAPWQLRPAIAPADALLLSLIAGIAVAEAVEQTTGLHPDLRWPNDVLLNGKKFCGILTEMSGEPTRVRYVVIGIGINVNHTSFAGELEPIATSLSQKWSARGRAWQADCSSAKIAQQRRYRKFVEDVSSARTKLVRNFEERSSFARSRHVHIDDNGGYEGVTEGLDERGFLLVRTATGLRTVLAGGVRALDGK